DGGLELIGPDGKRKWRAEGVGNAWSCAGAQLAKEGPDSILCVDGMDAIVVFDAAGKRVRTSKPGKDVGAVYGADLDGDGVDEILGLGTTQVSGNYLWVFSADGKLRWRQKAGNQYAAPDAPIIAGRFLPSGRQVAVGSGDGTVFLFTGDGKPLG